jgi:hypothetical protein
MAAFGFGNSAIGFGFGNTAAGSSIGYSKVFFFFLEILSASDAATNIEASQNREIDKELMQRHSNAGVIKGK